MRALTSISIILLTVIATVVTAADAADDETAIRQLEQLGAIITRDDNRPSRPVIEISFAEHRNS